MDANGVMIFSLCGGPIERILFDLLSDRIFYFETFLLSLDENFDACEYFWDISKESPMQCFACINSAAVGVKISQFFFAISKRNRKISSQSRFFNLKEEGHPRNGESIDRLLSPFLFVKIPEYINVTTANLREILLQVMTILFISQENFLK